MKEKDGEGRNLTPIHGEHIKGRGVTLTVGLRGEDASAVLFSASQPRPAERHTNGAREARKAQQF